jgi:hypothetical protein
MPVIPRRSFRSRGVFIILVLALGVAWIATPRAVAPVPQKGANKTVFAVALDADNKPVTDLTKEEWGVREDGGDRVLVELKPATDPLDVVLMVDTSKAINSSISELRAALLSFAHAIMDGTPGSSMSVFDVAAAAVMVADGKKTKEDVDKVLSRTIADQSETTVFLEGIVDASKKLAKSPSPRRAIVVVNLDGMPETSALQPQQVVQQIIASGASLWAVSYQNTASTLLSNRGGSGAGAAAGDSKGGGIGNGNTGQNRDIILTRVPPGTGGVRLTIATPNALDVTLGQVAAALAGQYAVTYTRPDGPMPKQLQMGQVRNGVRVVYPATPPK